MQLTNKDFQKNNFIFNIDKSNDIDLFLDDVKNKIVINFKENIIVNLNIRKINNDNDLVFNINDKSLVNIRIINENIENKISIESNLNKEAEINYYYVDFSNKNSSLNIQTNLLGKKAKGLFKFSSVSFDNLIKKYNICFDHKSSDTESNFEGYGVSKNKASIEAKGVSTIRENCVKSIANQKVKVILFDDESKAKASPTLRIYCDDIIANHACAVGHLNLDHVFYLKSRGLNVQEARKLITIGYLLPIDKYFDKNDKEKIDKYIEENF